MILIMILITILIMLLILIDCIIIIEISHLPDWTPWAKWRTVREEVPAGVWPKITGSRVCKLKILKIQFTGLVEKQFNVECQLTKFIWGASKPATAKMMFSGTAQADWFRCTDPVTCGIVNISRGFLQVHRSDHLWKVQIWKFWASWLNDDKDIDQWPCDKVFPRCRRTSCPERQTRTGRPWIGLAPAEHYDVDGEDDLYIIGAVFKGLCRLSCFQTCSVFKRFCCFSCLLTLFKKVERLEWMSVTHGHTSDYFWN